MARSSQFSGDGGQPKRFCGWSLNVREGEAEPEGLGRGGEEWLSMQLWVCEPRTSPAGWLAHEAGPGAASHVAPSQRLPWEQMVEPYPPPHPHPKRAAPAWLRQPWAWTRAGARQNPFYHSSSSQPYPMVLESQGKLIGVQNKSTVLTDRQGYICCLPIHV